MQENLVGYLLNSLDDETQHAVEAYLRSNPRARGELEVLRRALAPLEADREAPAPPPGLAARTVARVLQAPAKRLPRAPAMAGSGGEAVRPFWRRMDYLVAASILFVAIGLGLQGLYQMQFGHAKLQCQDNLRQLASALNTYRDMHRQFPDVTAVKAPRPAAGMVVPMLIDAGALPEETVLRCPNDPPSKFRPASLAELRNMTPREFDDYMNRVRSYAYSLGYRDPAGRYHAPAVPESTSSAVPLMADAPPERVDDGNSAQHSGRGQNVLFHDGHVKFMTSRSTGSDDDIYLNNARKVAAGLHQHDAVLGGSWARP